MHSDLADFLVYLFYGGAFFAIGVSITSRDTRSSRLAIARYLWIFALFAYIHGVHEWFDMYLNLTAEPLPLESSLAIDTLKLALIITSFCLLLFFGACVFAVAYPGRGAMIVGLAVLLAGGTLLSLLLPWEGTRPDFFTWADVRVRNFIALPGAIMTGIGFINFSGIVRSISRIGALNFTGAGVSVMVYGLFTGLIPSGTVLLPARLPVELFRGLSALAILHFIMKALQTFDEERKAVIEERLNRFMQSEKLSALGRLAAGIAHEINNPLANLSLNLEILKRNLEEEGALGRHGKRLDTMERDMERAARIAKELLHVSSERDSQFLEAEAESIVETALDLLGPRKAEYRISVQMDGVGVIRCIPWRLEEAVLNVLINAMDATPVGGEIRLQGRKDDGWIILELCDNGTGIEPEDLEKVMEPFFTTKEVGQGTGLGLSICYGIMQLHGGDLKIRSTPGSGTTVTLILPDRAKGGIIHGQDPGG